MNNVTVLDHPLIQHKVAMLRDKSTTTKDFRELVTEIAMLMGYEATRDLPLEETEIETPITKARVNMLAGRKVGIVPILRAGIGMVDGILSLMPFAKVGHIGLFRNEETLEPVEYYCKFPSDVEERDIIILDPMLATGGSASAAISLVKKRNVKSIKLMCIIAAPEGIERITKDHPDVHIFCAAMDKHLNENGYIVPGLGDAGDRLFGTK